MTTTTGQRLANESLEFRWFPLRAEHPDGTVQTITGYTVELGFTDARAATVAPTSWTAATWDGTITYGGDTWQLARILIGPAGDVTLTTGLWRAWARITGGAEIAVVPAGNLEVH